MFHLRPGTDSTCNQSSGSLGHCITMISIGPDNSVTDLRYKVDGGTGHPESILQGGVAVSSGQMSEGDCQLHS